MNSEKPENMSEMNDGKNNSSESEKMIESSFSHNEEKTQLNYGDIVIMIWRRVKWNVKMSVDLKT